MSSKFINRKDFLKCAGIGMGGLMLAGMMGCSPQPDAPAAKPSNDEVKKPRTQIKWRMQTHWPAGVEYYKVLFEGFCDKVREASAGELDITPLPPGTIVPTGDKFEAVGQGLFEIAWSFPSYWIGICPAAGHLNGQLFMWNSFDEMWLFFYEMGAMEIIEEAYAEHNLFPFPPQSAATLALWTKRPVRTIEDFRGLKIRSTGIPASVFEKAGATPVFFPGEELYSALQTGLVEGAHWGGVAAGWDMGFHEVTSYIIRPFLANVTNCEIFVNLDAWNALPDHLKSILYNVAARNAIDSHCWFMYNDYKRMEDFQAKGGEIVWLEDEAVAKLTELSLKVVDEYSEKDPKYCGRLGSMLKDFLKMVGRHP